MQQVNRRPMGQCSYHDYIADVECVRTELGCYTKGSADIVEGGRETFVRRGIVYDLDDSGQLTVNGVVSSRTGGRKYEHMCPTSSYLIFAGWDGDNKVADFYYWSKNNFDRMPRKGTYIYNYLDRPCAKSMMDMPTFAGVVSVIGLKYWKSSGFGGMFADNGYHLRDLNIVSRFNI